MKKHLLGILALLLPVVVFSAPVNLLVSWDAYPTSLNGQPIINGVMQIQCRTNQNAFTQVGTSSLQGPANVSLNANPGDSIDCLAVATAPGFAISPASGVGSTTVPLQVLPPATGVRVAP